MHAKEQSAHATCSVYSAKSFSCQFLTFAFLPTGRILDLIESGKLPTDAIRFFVLDEADRLLDTGNTDAILKMYRRFPKAGAGTHRLQVGI